MRNHRQTILKCHYRDVDGMGYSLNACWWKCEHAGEIGTSNDFRCHYGDDQPTCPNYDANDFDIGVAEPRVE